MSSTQVAGYGTDVWCGDSLVTGRMSRRAQTVLLALYRRSITPRGMLRGGDEESRYGLDLAGLVGAVGYPTAVLAIPGQLQNEYMKDPRVSGVRVDAAITTEPSGLQFIDLVAHVELHDEDGTFPLTLRVSAVDVEILGGVS